MSLTSFSFLISDKEKQIILKELSSRLQTPPTEHIDAYFVLDNCKISIYKNLKCLVQGQNAQNVIKKYFSNHLDVLTINESSQVTQSQLIFTNNIEQVNIIGSDEVGVGDYFGGLCICAVYLTNNDVPKLIELGVKDSKKLNDDTIIQIAKELIKFVKYDVTSIFPQDYNSLYEKYQNTHIIKTYGHYRSINNLINLINKEHLQLNKIVIDEYASLKKFNQYLLALGQENNLPNLEFLTQAENVYLAVAAASIIARYFFLIQINELSLEVGINLPLGAWNDNIEQAAIKLLNIANRDEQKINILLNKYVKKHFANTTKILGKL